METSSLMLQQLTDKEKKLVTDYVRSYQNFVDLKSDDHPFHADIVEHKMHCAWSRERLVQMYKRIPQIVKETGTIPNILNDE